MPKWYTPCPAIACSYIVILPLNVSTVVSYLPGFLRTRTVPGADKRLTQSLILSLQPD
ncbi:MAG: hypothetical protein F6K48_11205 [Okeania sp. SIO3H1]|uniref:hypothetical protein n=1 Tax=Okeania sp. SIO1I7 TaxID=2607772 RepID=UPI0013CD607F|nr:hypothetical protein [Okeania sp. SIO1I7]NEN89432.1 hypothetical protein [Okeania sp. SIO3H1]NET28465.1 hypothetical protein [Okeania sp. SIO1I7]